MARHAAIGSELRLSFRRLTVCLVVTGNGIMGMVMGNVVLVQNVVIILTEEAKAGVACLAAMSAMSG